VIGRKHPMWTGAEIGRLKKFYPVMAKAGLVREFSPRSWESIRYMAFRLGIKRPRHLGGKSNWKAIAKEHQPTFVLPTHVPVQAKRPWS
jgi:hypothetical protein